MEEEDDDDNDGGDNGDQDDDEDYEDEQSFLSRCLPLLALVGKGGVLGFDLSCNKLVGHLVSRL